MKKLKFSDSKKIVIKIGTSTITNDDGFDKEFLVKLYTEVSSWIDNGIGVVIVSSGAIFAGLAGNSDTIFNTSSIFGFLAISLAAINIFGGFLVTQRMLAMYKKKKKDK